MKKHLILTKSMILNNEVSLYLRLRFYRTFTSYQSCYLEKNPEQRSVLTYFDMKQLEKLSGAAIGSMLGVQARTWNKHKEVLMQPQMVVNSTDEHFTLMPFAVFDSFLLWLDSYAATFGAKEALLKFFCYMYFHAGQFQGEYQQSQENMAIELQTTTKLINKKLKILKDAG